jgi:predicted  nucleic acid-binding Zn-ribbon protein
MPDVTRDINLLVQIARLDASLHDHSVELSQLPARIRAAEVKIERCNQEEETLSGAFDKMKKERRTLEQKLQDDEARVAKFKNDLMSVKSNKEYTAVQKEIRLKEEEISEEEERLLELMDAIEGRESTLQGELGEISSRRDVALSDKTALEERKAFLESELEQLRSRKPAVLSELDDGLQRRYGRLLEKHGDVAVTRVEGETCGACHAQLPPQVAVEVRKNDHIITCQSCGRLLVHYAD